MNAFNPNSCFEHTAGENQTYLIDQFFGFDQKSLKTKEGFFDSEEEINPIYLIEKFNGFQETPEDIFPSKKYICPSDLILKPNPFAFKSQNDNEILSMGPETSIELSKDPLGQKKIMNIFQSLEESCLSDETSFFHKTFHTSDSELQKEEISTSSDHSMFNSIEDLSQIKKRKFLEKTPVKKPERLRMTVKHHDFLKKAFENMTTVHKTKPVALREIWPAMKEEVGPLRGVYSLTCHMKKCKKCISIWNEYKKRTCPGENSNGPSIYVWKDNRHEWLQKKLSTLYPEDYNSDTEMMKSFSGEMKSAVGIPKNLQSLKKHFKDNCVYGCVEAFHKYLKRKRNDIIDIEN